MPKRGKGKPKKASSTAAKEELPSKKSLPNKEDIPAKPARTDQKECAGPEIFHAGRMEEPRRGWDLDMDSEVSQALANYHNAANRKIAELPSLTEDSKLLKKEPGNYASSARRPRDDPPVALTTGSTKQAKLEVTSLPSDTVVRPPGLIPGKSASWATLLQPLSAVKQHATITAAHGVDTILNPSHQFPVTPITAGFFKPVCDGDVDVFASGDWHNVEKRKKPSPDSSSSGTSMKSFDESFEKWPGLADRPSPPVPVGVVQLVRPKKSKGAKKPSETGPSEPAVVPVSPKNSKPFSWGKATEVKRNEPIEVLAKTSERTVDGFNWPKLGEQPVPVKREVEIPRSVEKKAPVEIRKVESFSSDTSISDESEEKQQPIGRRLLDWSTLTETLKDIDPTEGAFRDDYSRKAAVDPASLPRDIALEVWKAFHSAILKKLLVVKPSILCHEKAFEKFLADFDKPIKAKQTYEDGDSFLRTIRPGFIIEAFTSIARSALDFKVEGNLHPFELLEQKPDQCPYTSLNKYLMQAIMKEPETAEESDENDPPGKSKLTKTKPSSEERVDLAWTTVNKAMGLQQKATKESEKKKPEDVSWYKLLVVLTYEPVKGSKQGEMVVSLGFVNASLPPKEFPVNTIEVYMDPSSPRPHPDKVVFISRLAPLTSDFRRCWAFSTLYQQPVQQKALLELPVSCHKPVYPIGIPVPEKLTSLNAVQQREAHAMLRTVFDRNSSVSILPLQGPPGTGKSRLIVGLVQAILDVNPEARIMITAPTNTAVDAVGQRIVDSLNGEDPDKAREYETVQQVIRFGNPNKITDSMQEYSISNRLDNQPLFDRKNADQMCREGRVFLATLNGCGSTRAIAANKLVRFSVVIVDEASQALMVDSIIPISILGARTIILVGDPKQLPATIMDKAVQDSGYGRSWLERIAFQFETRREAIPCLEVQYRMVKEICAFPSKNFYHGKLKTFREQQEAGWKLQPLKFLNVQHAWEQNEGRSYYNTGEIEVIQQLLEQCSYAGIQMGHIAVITGYAAQRRHLIAKFRKTQFQHALISTVDGFQGQEAKMIIISCVRTGQKVGFFGDPQRLNVSITRAKNSLFIVGNKLTMKHDRIWRDLVDHMEGSGNLVNTGRQGVTARDIRLH